MSASSNPTRAPQRRDQRIPVARRWKSQFYIYCNSALLNSDLLDALGGHQILAQIRVHIALEGGFHIGARNGCHR